MKRYLAAAAVALVFSACGSGGLSDEALEWCSQPNSQDALIDAARELELQLDFVLLSADAPGGAVVSDEFAAWLETGDGEKACKEAYRAR